MELNVRLGVFQIVQTIMFEALSKRIKELKPEEKEKCINLASRVSLTTEVFIDIATSWEWSKR